MRSAYLLIGRERYLKKEFVRELREKIFPAGSDPSLNSQEFSAGSHKLGAVLDFLSTAPFLADRRLAVLWDLEELEEDDREGLLEAIGRMPASAVLVLVSEATNAKKDAFLAALSERCELVACHPPFEKDLPGWVAARAKRYGKRFEPDAVRGLIERAGREVSSLGSAMEQLSVYVGERASVTGVDVAALLGRSAQEDIFALSDLVFEGKSDAAVRVMRSLLADGAHPIEVLGAFAGQLERLRRASQAIRSGKAPREAAAQAGVHPFFQEKFLSQVRRVTEAKIRSLQTGLWRCDREIKSGSVPDELALERWLLECSLEKKAVI